MASDVQTPRYEIEVDDNIAQVGHKIRLGDLGRGALAIACLLFGYALFVSVLDLSMGGSDAWGPLAIRLIVFAAFLIGFAVLGTRIVLRYLANVNPYYAARRLEETIPGSKNSLINWLDLKDEPLPPVIHQAVGMRAARDVADADADLVTSQRDLWKLGATTAILFVGLLILFAIVPRQFGSLFARAMFPIRTGALSAGTAITILKPGTGDVVAPANQRVEFLARIEGRVPPANTQGAPALHYRYTTNDIAVRVPLEEDINGQWGARLSPDQLRTGLFWKMTAADASTPEMQLRVRSQPFVTRYEATYTYLPYRKLAPETVTMPNETMPQPRLAGHRGTQVVLKARTNAPVKSGVLEFDLQGMKKTVAAQLPVNEPQTLVFRFDLEKSGTFRIFFETPEGERNIDRSPYPVDVMEDGAPTVDLIKPAKDLVAPANGTVLLAGFAFDDFGVTALQLQMTVGQAASLPSPKTPPATQPLAPLPYKNKLGYDNGTFPLRVEYVDVLPLDQLRTPDGKQVTLRAGDEITYWLEATDNNDFGRPNVGKSKTYKITIEEGLKPALEQKKERREAEQQKEQHDKNQSDERDQQNKNDGKKDDKGKDGKGPGQANGGAKDGNDPKAKGNDNNPKDNPSKNGAGENGNGQNNQPSPEEQKQNDLKNQLSQTAKKLNDAIDKNKSEQKGASDPSNSQNENKGGNKSPDKSGEEKSPKQDGAKGGNEAKSDSTKSEPDKKDDAASKKDESKAGADSGDGAAGTQKGASKANPNNGTGGNKKSAKSERDKGDGNDPNTKTAEKGNNPNGVEKKTDKTDKPDIVEKGKSPESGKTGAPTEKSSGDSNPSQAKGNEGKESANSTSKVGGKKDGEPEPLKGVPPNESLKNATLGKKKGGKDDGHPPTKEEIEALKELLKKGGPEADAAAKEIAKRGQDLKDSGLKKDLENTLKEAGRDEDVKELNGMNREVAPMPEQVGEGPKDGQGAAPKEGALKNPGNDPSPLTNTGGRGLFEELKKITPEEAFARRMGNLQLDNLDELKKRIGPDILKKANVSDEEWQRFLANAQKLNEIKQQIRNRDDAGILKGGLSKIRSQGPRQVQPNPNAKLNSTQGGYTPPPPEFREAQEDWTRKK